MPGKGTSRRYPHGKSVKHSKIYDALRKQGMSKSRAAAISNATKPKRARKRRGS